MVTMLPWHQIDGTRKRASSYDVSGGNMDCWTFAPGETRTLLEHEGSPGALLHIWFTLYSEDPSYLRNTAVSIQFDGEVTVAEVPIGIFTGTGPWAVNDLVSQPVSIMRSRRLNKDQQGVGFGSVNLTWYMPFSSNCIVQIHNRSEKELMMHFYVDYLAECAPPSARPLLFHANHNLCARTVPQRRHASETDMTNDLIDYDSRNLSNEHNYVWADIDGFEGNYVGTVLAVESHPDRHGKWYEGDDMFFIDGRSWPPALHGTGTEDYFGMAWGVHRRYQGWNLGVTHYERGITDHDRFYDGRFVVYRWHLADPIPFRRSLHASIEAGHANDCEQSYESVAFWYGRRVEPTNLP
ncbi:MAG: DUF2961 domain-containing protein [Verrucomicrobia bacterium]|nr:DUF2961 domain-containing protein [Verrucomicrobiota bacterium]MQC28211.1 DUF2961 domain-containing protein [Chloroflexota bacterium]